MGRYSDEYRPSHDGSLFPSAEGVLDGLRRPEQDATSAYEAYTKGKAPQPIGRVGNPNLSQPKELPTNPWKEYPDDDDKWINPKRGGGSSVPRKPKGPKSPRSGGAALPIPMTEGAR